MSVKTKFSSDAIISCSREQISCTLSGESVILHVKDGVYYGLNEVGAVVWNALQQPKSVAQLHETVLEQFDVGREECEQDVAMLLLDLSEAGLIDVVGGASA